MSSLSARTLRLVLLAPLAVVLAALLGAGCSNDYSESEATDRCNVEQTSRGACVSSAVLAQCVTCFEQCGDACVITQDCPGTYTCPASSH